jgi:hypothetical protein
VQPNFIGSDCVIDGSISGLSPVKSASIAKASLTLRFEKENWSCPSGQLAFAELKEQMQPRIRIAATVRFMFSLLCERPWVNMAQAELALVIALEWHANFDGDCNRRWIARHDQGDEAPQA